MSEVGPEGRSYVPIAIDNLIKLADIARRDRDAFFESHTQWARLYQERVLCTALCQGAAQHYVDGRTGINDFDVYTFYRARPEKPWYGKRIKSYDFGDPKFGQSVDRKNFIGRRVDCLGRSIQAPNSEDAASALQRYLKQGKTKTARLLALKAIILLEPDVGKIVWPS